MSLPDPEFYRIVQSFEPEAALFQPWLGYGEFGRLLHASGSLHPPPRLYFIHQLLKQALALAPGEVWELGVHRGESASFLGEVALANARTLRLFDSFEGMLKVDPERDNHKVGDFSDTSLDLVKTRLAAYSAVTAYNPGWVPETLVGQEETKIVFAHIDLDLYQPILSATAFIWPRLPVGGSIVYDDYGWTSCPGARQAVDEFFAERPEEPIVLPTCQAVVTKLV